MNGYETVWNGSREQGDQLLVPGEVNRRVGCVDEPQVERLRRHGPSHRGVRAGVPKSRLDQQAAVRRDILALLERGTALTIPELGRVTGYLPADVKVAIQRLTRLGEIGAVVVPLAQRQDKGVWKAYTVEAA